jgi:hypothetical protein
MLTSQNTQHHDVDRALQTLKRVAAVDPGAAADIKRKLAEAGFGLPANLAAIGDFDPTRGVYLGTDKAALGQVVHAYVAEDLLRNGNGRPLSLNFRGAVRELSERNGRSYGNGTDRATKQAIVDGTYQDGDLVLPSKELLHGRDVMSETTRPGQNICAVLKADKLPKIAAAITGNDDQLWAVTGSEHPYDTSLVCRVSLTGKGGAWSDKHYSSSVVVPVRYFRSLPQGEGPSLKPGG